MGGVRKGKWDPSGGRQYSHSRNRASPFELDVCVQEEGSDDGGDGGGSGSGAGACEKTSGPHTPRDAVLDEGTGPGPPAIGAAAPGEAGAGTASVGVGKDLRVAHCTKCARHGLTKDVVWRNRDRNGAANICLLGCRALVGLIGGTARSEVDTRPAPWRRQPQQVATQTKTR